MRTRSHVSLTLGLLLLAAGRVSAQQYQYPFQNPNLPLEQRVENIISLMTPDEKIYMLGQSPGVPRLGIRTMQQVEGLHGVRGGAGSSTTYPQAIGLGETWDVDVLHQVGFTEGYEARYMQRRARGSIIIRRRTPIWAATSAGAAPRSATARTPSSTARSSWPSSRACRATTPSTGRPPPS